MTAATVAADQRMEGKGSGCVGGRREVCRVEVKRGEGGAGCGGGTLHFVWIEEEAQGCVKDTNGKCCFVLFCINALHDTAFKSWVKINTCDTSPVVSRERLGE